jgi:hypothetical protein
MELLIYGISARSFPAFNLNIIQSVKMFTSKYRKYVYLHVKLHLYV